MNADYFQLQQQLIFKFQIRFNYIMQILNGGQSKVYSNSIVKQWQDHIYKLSTIKNKNDVVTES